MARTIDATITPPTRTTVARTEIADANGRGSGWAAVHTAINSAYEQHRGSGIADADPLGLMTSNADTLRYKIPIQGESSSDEQYEVWIYGKITTAGSATVQAAATNSGDSGTVAVTSTTSDWWQLSTFDVSAGGSDHETIEITVTGTPTATIRIDAVAGFYARNRSSALPAVSSGSDAYPDGYVPHDLDASAGERVLTATRVRTTHENLRALYLRPWSLIASSNARSGWTNTTRTWRAEVPPQIVARTVTARVYVYVVWTGVSGVTDKGELTLTSLQTGDTASLVSITASGWYGAFDVDVSAPAEGVVRPRYRAFTLEANDHVSVYSVCGWWSGLSYGA